MTADFPDYDAGLININGGSDVDWWLDYIRSEIGRANDHWRDEMTAALAREAALRMLANELSWASKTRDISNRILAVLEVKK